MELRGCPEMSVRNYDYSLRKNTQERSFHVGENMSIEMYQ